MVDGSPDESLRSPRGEFGETRPAVRRRSLSQAGEEKLTSAQGQGTFRGKGASDDLRPPQRACRLGLTRAALLAAILSATRSKYSVPVVLCTTGRGGGGRKGRLCVHLVRDLQSGEKGVSQADKRSEPVSCIRDLRAQCPAGTPSIDPAPRWTGAVLSTESHRSIDCHCSQISS